MKNRLLLLSSILLCLSSVGATSQTSPIIEFKSGPLALDNTQTVMEVRNLSKANRIITVNIYIVNDLYPSGATIKIIKFTAPGTKVFTYNNEFTRFDNSIMIKWEAVDGKKVYKETFHTDLSNGNMVRLNDSIYKYESNSSIADYSSQKGVSSYKQELLFYNFEDKYIPNFYHKIDLSLFKIKNLTGFPSTLSMGSSSIFLISSQNNVFSNFGKSTKISLPIVLVYSNDEYHLEFKDSLYVNPITLEMAPNKLDGFVETKHFYLPRDKKRSEEIYEFSIKLDQVDLDKNSYVVNFRYKSLLNTFGDCRNSEYCIVNK